MGRECVLVLATPEAKEGSAVLGGGRETRAVVASYSKV